MDEAELRDGVPATGGWFVVNARDVPWMHNAMRAVCRFGGQGEAHFDGLGIALYAIEPGTPMSLYHHEAGQEDFLILRGRCTLLIDGETREAGRWDFIHCPPRTAHTIAATGEEPALVLAIGARVQKGSARYPVSDEAIALGAGVPDEHTPAREVYDSYGEPRRGPAPDLPGADQATNSAISARRSSSEANR